MLYLKDANLKDIEKEYTFLQELPNENGFENNCYGLTMEEFIVKLNQIINNSMNLDLPEGYVPSTYCFLWDNDNIVGLFKIRHYLNDKLKQHGGHIGFGIHPKYRNMKYGTKGLTLAIEKLKNIMIDEEDEIYMSCNTDNLASLKIQLDNGAYIAHADKDTIVTRIKVK